MHVLNSDRSINEMSDLITLLSMYVYQVFGLANMKLMQTAEIKFIMVHDDFELSPDIVPVSFPPMQLLVSKLNFEICYWLYLSSCLLSTRYPP